jgi:ABC-type transport system involved in multi-copper enzyme maturation permease subunit
LAEGTPSAGRADMPTLTSATEVETKYSSSWLWKPPSSALSAALLLTGAGGLYWFGKGAGGPGLLLGWVLWLAASVVLLRRGWLRLFGPVLFYDLISLARRGRYVLLRIGYALALLFTLYNVYGNYEYALRAINTNAMAEFGQAFFFTFVCIQFLAVLLLTPAYTAGAIAEEKERKTLEFLLATDLRNREIVLSKLVARVANLGLLVLTGLPVLSLTQLWGGVDPEQVIDAFAVAGLTLASLGSLSILCSIYFKKPRDAILLTYLVMVAYFGCSGLSAVLLSYPSIAGISVGTGPNAISLKDLIQWFNAGNIAFALLTLRDAFRAKVPVTSVLPGLLRNYAIFHCAAAMICTAVAVARLRVVATRNALDESRLTARASRLRRRWRIGRRPMLWKEVVVDPGLAFNRFGRALIVLIVLASLVPAVWIGAQSLWGLASNNNFWGHLYFWQTLGTAINLWVRIVGTAVACLTLVGVAARAAGSVTGERDRQTLDGLLTSPLESRTILSAKWLGSIFSLRWAWAWLCLVWGIGLITDGLDIASLPWLVLACFVYASFLAALGLWFSVRSPTTLRATLGTLATAAVVSFGHWLILIFFSVPKGMRPQANPIGDELLRAIQLYGLTPPVSLAWLSFRGSEFGVPYVTTGSQDNPWHSLLGLLVGLLLWSVAAVALWRSAVRRFRQSTNRLPARRSARKVGSLTNRSERRSGPEDTSEVNPLLGPVPARPRRLKRILAAILLLALAFGVWRIRAAYLSHVADRSLQESISDLDSHDPGWRWEEIEASRHRAGDGFNAATYVLAASKQLPTVTTALDNLFASLQTYPPQMQLSEQHATQLHAELQNASGGLAQTATLETLSTGCYTLKFSEPGLIFLTHLNALQLVKFWLYLDVLREAQDGDGDSAVTACQRLLNAGRSIGDEPLLHSQITRRRIVCDAMRAAERALAQGQPGELTLSAFHHLLEDEQRHPAAMIAARGQRAIMDQTMRALQSGDLTLTQYARYGEKNLGAGSDRADQLMRWLRPERLTAARATVLDGLGKWVWSTRQPIDFWGPGFKLELDGSEEDPVARQLLRTAYSFITDSAKLLLQQEAELRCGTLMIALERFRREHRRWPGDLDELYLGRTRSRPPGFPPLTVFAPPPYTDPYARQPLRYERLSDGVVIYSIGPKGWDNGGNVDRTLSSSDSDVGFRLWDVERRRQPPKN